MADIWNRLERMCRIVNPNEPNGGLRAPATSKQIAEAENAQGVEFPEDLRQAYSRFNGTGIGVHQFRLFPRRFAWIGIAEPSLKGEMFSTWQIMSSILADERAENPSFASDVEASRQWVEDDNGPLYLQYQDLSRILVASMGTEDGIFVDTQPPPAGTVGQLVYADPQDPGSSLVIAQSFTHAIECLVVAYENGKIRFGDIDGDGWTYAEDGRLVGWEELAAL